MSHTPSFLDRWNELVALPAAEAFRALMMPLAEDADCQALLEPLSQLVARVAIDKGDDNPVLVVTFRGEPRPTSLRLFAPDGIPSGVLPRYAKVLELFNGAHFDGLGYSGLGVSLNEVGEGGYFGSGMFDPSEGWEGFCERYAPELSEHLQELSIPIDLGSSDHYIQHPTKVNASGEPEVVYLGHDRDALQTRGPGLGVGGHFLNILADCLLENRPHDFVG